MVFLVGMVATFGPYGVVGGSVLTIVGVAMVLVACLASLPEDDPDAGLTLP